MEAIFKVARWKEKRARRGKIRVESKPDVDEKEMAKLLTTSEKLSCHT